MRSVRVWAVVIGMAFVSEFSAAAQPRWATRVDAIGAEIVAETQTVGLSVAVAVDGEIVYERAFGAADLEYGIELQPASLMRVASVTKQFTAAAIMSLIESGDLSLDTALAEALPDWPISVDKLSGKEITIGQLLSHTSGIRNYSGIDRYRNELVAVPLDLASMAELIEDEPFTHEPGTAWRYSNTGYWLLGAIVERASGKALESFLRAGLFGPARLELTRMDSNEEIIKNRARGYVPGPDGPRNDELFATENIGGAGALLSTARELAEWTVALSSGEVISIASYQAMVEPRNATSLDDWFYGYGLMIDENLGDELIGRKKIFHTGGIFGFNAFLAHYTPTAADPRDIVISVLCSGFSLDTKFEDRPANRAEARIASAVLLDNRER